MGNKYITVSVIGGSKIDENQAKTAYKVGQIVAKYDAVLVYGGLQGSMEAAARGAKEAGGLTIGLLPGNEKSDANAFIDIALPTSIGYARNAIVACSADVIIALEGSYGTSSEISYAMVYKRPVIDMGGWDVEGTIKADSLEDCEKKLKELLEGVKKKRS